MKRIKIGETIIEVDSADEVIDILAGLGLSNGKKTHKTTTHVALMENTPVKTKRKAPRDIKRKWTLEETNFVRANFRKTAIQMKKAENSPLIARSIPAIQTYRWKIKKEITGGNKTKEIQVEKPWSVLKKNVNVIDLN